MFFLTTSAASAQVGVGVTGSVNSSAKLQVDASDKGFLPPRVALTSTATASNAISSPAVGLLVYNTATAGTSPSDVTPGLYYYDGAKWQRVINQQPDATVTFNGSNPNTGSGFSGDQQSTNFIYVSNDDASQWIWKPNATPSPAYVTYTPPASSSWYSQSTLTDAGSNKTSGIYRTGNVGIGTASFTPTTKLDIRASSSGTGLRLVDGSQGANKVLKSDANGYASWTTNVSVTPAVIGTLGTEAGNTGPNNYTGASITLPPGIWSVSVSMLGYIAASGNHWIQTYFTTSSTVGSGAPGVAGGPTLISGLVVGNSFNMITGTAIINNSTGTVQTYYYWTGSTNGQTLINIGRDEYGENSIVAYPMNLN
jgi:hypothetical protein